MSFERIAIVNRGEPAMRLINAVDELNLERGTNLRTIALYTEPDRRAMFVRRAHESVDLGSATYADADGHRRVRYLDYEAMSRALLRCRAEAVWVGWGFVAEHAAFAELCAELGVVFIGPDAEVMRRLGDKITSKLIAESSDVPVAPWSGGPVNNVEEALAHGARLGYPLMVKATAGGGGRGIRRVDDAAELESAFQAAQSEARSAFGDETVFLESLVAGARHIEVQIIADGHGTVWPVGVRDCTVQRRHQKVLEEAPSPALTPQQHREVLAAAARLGRAAGYQNAGTVEFLYDPGARRFWFMEVNARLQVEHPITEVTTGLDLVKLQLHVARGGRLEGEPPAAVGHAIEARLNAEDAERGFAPAPGRIEVLRLPTGPGLRVDTGVEQGDEIASEYDSMIAKIIAFGHDREEARSRLRRAIQQTAVVVRDGATNKAFLEALVAHPDFAAGEIDVHWVDRLGPETRTRSGQHADVAMLAAAIDTYEHETRVAIANFRATAVRGRPEVDDAIGGTARLRHRGSNYDLAVFRLGANAYRVEVDGHPILVRREDYGGSTVRISVGGNTHRVVSAVHGVTHLVEVDGHPHRISHDEGGVVRSPAPAVVTAIDVEPGQTVAIGDRLAVIEAMKTETAILSELEGTVREVLVVANTQVAAGMPLLVIEPTGTSESSPSDQRLDFAALGGGPDLVHDRCRHWLEAIHQLLLGYDIDTAWVEQLSPGARVACTDSIDDAERRRLEDEILSVFADVVSLFGREPADGIDGEPVRQGTEMMLFDYLRRIESRGRDLPAPFRAALERALHDLGVDRLEPSPELEAALYRIARSHRRMERQLGPVVRVLERRLEDPQPGDTAGLRTVLERISRETRSRYPAVHDLADELHNQVFDLPFLEEIRDRALDDADRHVAALAGVTDAAERAGHVRALVDCPQPLKTHLSRRFAEAPPELQGALLEVMTLRYYRIRELVDVALHEVDGRPIVTGRYPYEGDDIRLLAVHVDYDDLAAGASAVDRLLDELGHGEGQVVVDIYVWRPEPSGDVERLRHELVEKIGAVLGPRQLRRIVVAVSGTDSGIGMAGVLHFTLRPDGFGAYIEETVWRDLHPMMGKRLELWRLDRFDIHRLPTPEDIYFFHATAKENRRDERLFALGEVRDLTPIVDDEGRVQRLPEMERVFREARGAIRRFQARRPADRRLAWNRIVLFVWPPFDLSPDDISRIVDRLTPEIEGLGLQKVQVLASVRDDATGELTRRVFEVTTLEGDSARIRVRRPAEQPIRPLSDYEQKVARLRQRGLVYPFEIIRFLTPTEVRSSSGIPTGDFVEYDLVDGTLQPVEREPGHNACNIVVGVIANRTERYPEGMRRVILLGDPTRGMGNLAEPECARIIAALDLAETLGVPLEWFAVSAGALIAMDSGTENMDWIARVLRRIIEFTQVGGEVNVVVAGINVGAQPYWNAEATMLMHTRGILIMTPASAMVLTGKQALDYSGGVSAEDNQGIGGYERVMGPNGQAQYFARDLAGACRVLLSHYDYTYVEPGERFPRRAVTADPVGRDVCAAPHGGEFTTIGEIFDEGTNPGRKKPFEVRRLMAAVVDQDHPSLERWLGMRDAEIVVVQDAVLGGHPVCLIGMEAKNVPRAGMIPADGPDVWTSSTLFPMGSKKVARSINAASGNRPVVVLANLSGFDGSPESLRNWQLEFGAEIGRAVVNFRGPMVFCVVSRYHGGAFVVFSRTLNEDLEVAALEGAHASVIGGAPAAAVVFAGDVRRRIEADPRVKELETAVQNAAGQGVADLLTELARVREEVRAEKMGEVAAEFDEIHDVHRALAVGSIDCIVAPARLRPYLIDAIERGMQRELERGG